MSGMIFDINIIQIFIEKIKKISVVHYIKKKIKDLQKELELIRLQIEEEEKLLILEIEEEEKLLKDESVPNVGLIVINYNKDGDYLGISQKKTDFLN
jgi:hypothetical protein